MSSENGNVRGAAKKAWGYRHVILGTVWLLYVINYLDRISVLTFLPYIQKDLKLTPVEVGWLGSIFFIGYALAMFSAGFLADRWGSKKTMNIAILAFSFVTFLTGFVRTLTQFMVLRLALAFGEGHHYVPSNKIIANWFPREEKGRASGFFSTSWAVGPAIVPIIVTWLSADLFGGAWRPVFFVLTVPGIIGLLLLWRFVADSPEEMLASGKVKREEHELITSSVGTDLVKKTYSTKLFTFDAQFYLYCIGWIVELMLFWGLTVWISMFLVKQYGFSMKEMGLASALPFGMAIVGTYGGGWVSDRFFLGWPKFVTLVGYLGCIPVFYFISHVPIGQTASLIIWLALAGFFINMPWGVMQAYPLQRYPKEVVGRALGIATGIATFGSFLSPVVSGYLVKTLPDGHLDFSNVFIFWSALAIVGAVAVAFLKEKSVEHTDDFETGKE